MTILCFQYASKREKVLLARTDDFYFFSKNLDCASKQWTVYPVYRQGVEFIV